MAVSANRLELLQIADAVAREKVIDRQIVLAAMEDAIAKAARARYGDDIRLKLIEPRRPLISLPQLGFPARSGLTAELIAAIEDRALWSRLGL